LNWAVEPRAGAVPLTLTSIAVGLADATGTEEGAVAAGALLEPLQARARIVRVTATSDTAEWTTSVDADDDFMLLLRISIS